MNHGTGLLYLLKSCPEVSVASFQAFILSSSVIGFAFC